jgi:integrase
MSIKEQNLELVEKAVYNFAESTKTKKINDAKTMFSILYQKCEKNLLDYSLDELEYAFREIQSKQISALRKRRYLIALKDTIDYVLRDDVINRRTDRIAFFEFVFSKKFIVMKENGTSREFIQITSQEIKELLQELRKVNVRDYIFCSILAFSGCRISGLVNLKIKDIDFEKAIFYTQEKRTSSSSGRCRYFLPNWFMKEIQVYIQRNGLTNENNICNITDKAVRKNLKRYKKDWWLHLMRHTIRANWYLNGMQKPDADMLLNHKPDSVDSIYLKSLNNVTHLREAYNKFFPYN